MALLKTLRRRGEGERGTPSACWQPGRAGLCWCRSHCHVACGAPYAALPLQRAPGPCTHAPPPAVDTPTTRSEGAPHLTMTSSGVQPQEQPQQVGPLTPGRQNGSQTSGQQQRQRHTTEHCRAQQFRSGCDAYGGGPGSLGCGGGGGGGRVWEHSPHAPGAEPLHPLTMPASEKPSHFHPAAAARHVHLHLRPSMASQQPAPGVLQAWAQLSIPQRCGSSSLLRVCVCLYWLGWPRRGSGRAGGWARVRAGSQAAGQDQPGGWRPSPHTWPGGLLLPANCNDDLQSRKERKEARVRTGLVPTA